MVDENTRDGYGRAYLPISKELEEKIIRLFNMGYSIDDVFSSICREPLHHFIRKEDIAKFRPKGKLILPPELEERVYIRWKELGYPKKIQEVLKYLHSEGHVMLELSDIKHICVRNKEEE